MVLSANNLYDLGHSKTHFLVVLSANKPGQSLRHSEVKLYAKNPTGHVVTQRFVVVSEYESGRVVQFV